MGRLTNFPKTAVLIAVECVAWMLFCVPAYLIGGNAGVEGLTWASVLCLLPGLFVLRKMASATDLASRTWLAMIAMVVRVFFVLAGVLVIGESRPDLHFFRFHIWLVVCYNIMMWTEIILILSKPKTI